MGDDTYTFSGRNPYDYVQVARHVTDLYGPARFDYHETVRVELVRAVDKSHAAFPEYAQCVDLTPEEAIRMAHSLMEYANMISEASS